MSQQEMQFEHNQQNDTKIYDSGYEAFIHNNTDYEASRFNQKIGSERNTPEDAHLREHMLNLRMGMAITSLVFWMIFFFVGIAIILHNPTVNVIQPLVIMGLGVFTVFVILANVLINRKKI